VIDKNIESTTNDQVKTFYENMKKKVQQYLFENGIDTITEDGYGLNKLFLFKEGYEDGTVGDRAQQNVTVTDPIRSVMTRKYLNDPGEIQQGVNNPVLRHTTQKILSIDSHYRDNLLFRPKKMEPVILILVVMVFVKLYKFQMVIINTKGQLMFQILYK